jgi:hypothetical protein
MRDAILPPGERLRRAVRWLSEQGRHDAAAIEEAARRFDLTPLEEAFLLRHCAARPQQPGH